MTTPKMSVVVPASLIRVWSASARLARARGASFAGLEFRLILRHWKSVRMEINHWCCQGTIDKPATL